MSRSLIIGDTDYSRQTLSDIIIDLNDYLSNIERINSFFLKTIEELSKNEYWKKEVSHDFRIMVNQSIQLFTTSLNELNEIIIEVRTEIRKDHINRIINIGKSAKEMWKKYGKIWHNHYPYKDFDDVNFKLIEQMYYKGRDMLGDMFDLLNLGERLRDFEGGKSNKTDSIIEIKPNFYGIGVNLRALFKYIKKYYSHKSQKRQEKNIKNN